jgi:hypothetical protein
MAENLTANVPDSDHSVLLDVRLNLRTDDDHLIAMT